MKDSTSLATYYKSQEVEELMLPKPINENDKLVKRIFKSSPLLGDYIIPAQAYDRYYAIAKKMIDDCIRQMRDKGPEKHYLTEHHEILTLIVVELAKLWNRDAEKSFSKYVALSFGYSGDDNRVKVWSIVTNSIYIALDRNKKLFVRLNGHRKFHETILVHSIGPMKSWYPLFDLLFEFYKQNLLYYFDVDDPLFVTLVNALSKKFEYIVDDEEELLIASQHYRLRVGIRRLVQNCPNYCVVLFKDIVYRMHCLINGDRETSDRYVFKLLDNWFLNKTRAESIKAASEKYKEEIVFNHKTIIVRYYQSAHDLYLKIPAIRINETEALNAYAEVYIDGKTYKHKLNVYGNELGRTIQHSSILIEEGSLKGNNIDTRIRIFYGEQLLHDSENKLSRQVLFFDDGREVFANDLECGNYTLIRPLRTQIDGTKFELLDTERSVSSVTLHKGFEIICNGHTIAIDATDVRTVRVVEPDYIRGVCFVLHGNRYKIISKEKLLSVYSPIKDEFKQYNVYINGIKANLFDLKDDNAGNRAIIRFDNEDTSKYEIKISKKDRSVLFKDYYYVSNLNYTFNREYYTNADNEQKGLMSLLVDGQRHDIKINEMMQKVSIKNDEGEIVIDIPRINYSIMETQKLNGQYIWCGDISNNSSLSFNNSTDKSFEVKIGDDIYQNPVIISLGKYKTSNSASTLKMVMMVEAVEYSLGEIVYYPFFTDKPIIKYSDNTISCLWEMYYVGGKDDLNLLIHIPNDVISFPLQIKGVSNSSFIADNFTEGEYEYEIYSSLCSVPIVKDKMFIGSEKYSRFYNRTICLQYITDSNSEIAESRKIKPIYIENVSFVVSEYVPAEDGIYDIYSGQMYWINNSGTKVYYSDDYNEEKHKYKVNPVKVIYLNDRYFRIVTQDDDGLYYHFYSINGEENNQITDRIPSINSTSFSDVLFFVNEHGKTDKEEICDEYEDSKLRLDEYQSDIAENNDMDIVGTSKDGQHRRLRVKNYKPMFSHWEETEQKHIIDADVHERIIVNAGPGTGKTWSLIEKIIYLVNDLNVDPETIQVLCFSRAAVEEIKERMKQAILNGRADMKTNYVDIRTFDSFATQLLYWIKDSDYKILKKSFQIELLNYDERIEKLSWILQREPDVVAQCSHLIVDEVQDLVLSRAELVLQMIQSIPKESGVTLLGDCCQAIYGYQVEEGGLNTEDFYQCIYDNKEFKRFSFTKNHRQTEWWDDICKTYRSSIMNSSISECNASLRSITAQIPEYETLQITDFTENTLDRIQNKGTVAILTRSNAQALKIANIFKKKNLDYVIRRKRNEGKLNKWIAFMFNSELRQSFDKDTFFAALNQTNSDNPIDQDVCDEIWSDIITRRRNSTGSIASRDILLSICNHALSKGFYMDESKCNTVISTIHRSKGREFENVIVDKDLVEQNKNELEEHRVTYVALSRAKDNVYSVKLPEVYFKTLENRRCYSWNKYGKNRNLQYIEVGFDRDFDDYSFCVSKGCQEYIRCANHTLIGKRAYLKKRDDFSVSRAYNLYIEGTNRVFATTGSDFINDLEDAIRQLKNLSPNIKVYDSLFPARLVDIYVSNIATSIGMVRGNEFGVNEYGDRICWNTLIVEGYARAEYTI